jgi:hypothetical protein
MNPFFCQRALRDRWRPSQVRIFFISLGDFRDKNLFSQECSEPMCYRFSFKPALRRWFALPGKQASFRFVPRRLELETA